MNHETDDPDRSAAPPREDSGDTMVLDAADLARMRAEASETRSVSAATIQAAIPTQPLDRETVEAIKRASDQGASGLPEVAAAPRGAAGAARSELLPDRDEELELFETSSFSFQDVREIVDVSVGVGADAAPPTAELGSEAWLRLIRSGSMRGLGVVLDPEWGTGPCLECALGALESALGAGFRGRFFVVSLSRTATSRARLALGIGAAVSGLVRSRSGPPVCADLARESVAQHPWGLITCLEYDLGASAPEELVESLGMLPTEHAALSCVLHAQRDRTRGALALVRPPDVAVPPGRFDEFSFDLEEAS